MIDNFIARLNTMHDEYETDGKILAEVSIHRIDKTVRDMGANFRLLVSALSLMIIVLLRQEARGPPPR